MTFMLPSYSTILCELLRFKAIGCCEVRTKRGAGKFRLHVLASTEFPDWDKGHSEKKKSDQADAASVILISFGHEQQIH